MDDLRRDIESLRRSHRRLAAGLTLALAGLVVTWVAGAVPQQRKPGPVVATDFLLVDEKGRELASLWHEAGTTALTIGDGKKKERIMVGTTSAGGSMIAVESEDGKSVVTLIATPDEDPYLGFKDRDGQEHKLRP